MNSEEPIEIKEESKPLHNICAGCKYQQSGKCKNYLFQNQGLTNGKPLVDKNSCPYWIDFNRQEITETASRIEMKITESNQPQ
ncbi:MAG: hypothetical protein QXS38_00770 [Candidatus Pacearchaeota archaeon]